MISSIGYFLLSVVLTFSFLTSLTLISQNLKLPKARLLIKPFTHATFFSTLLATCVLAYGFAIDDFSLAYVASHSNSLLPVQYKIAAVWGGHEGSMLFWVLILATWSAFIATRKHLPINYLERCLQIMALLVFAITLFVFMASNPFEVSSVVPLEGRDLNPMLQDIGLIIHPPLLYLGYVGLATIFSAAFAALTIGEEYVDWTLVVRPWLLVAWSMLTAGIGLGAWWAYYELGWGGWWFWDPVENASLLPWLVSTALIHSLLLSNSSLKLRKWSYSLAFITFSLSILGTFIVRSGILTSVHAFAIDANKGISLLLLLAALLVAGLGVLIWRANDIKSKPITKLNSVSFLMFSSVALLVTATFTVFLGTFYPMIFELAGLGRISVGAPYFNLIFAPLALIALFGIGLAEVKINSRSLSGKVSAVLVVASLVIAVFVYFWLYGGNSNWVFATTSLFVWVILSQSIRLFNGTKINWASLFAHCGIAILSLGASFNAFHSSEISEKMAPNISTKFIGLDLHYESTDLVVGPNYTAERAMISISKDNDLQFVAMPEKRHYQVRVMNMSEPSINWFWHGDVYLTLGEKLDDQHFAVRIQYKAGVRWIWVGFIFVVIGGLLGVMSKPNRGRNE